MQKLFVVSNRLPITIEQKENGYHCRQSSGGLISAVSAYINKSGKDLFREIVWTGVPGCDEEVWSQTSFDGADYTYMPVFPDARQYEHYYNGFSNSLLWPLFHYFPSFAEYNPAHFEAYLAVNEIFANLLAAKLRETDVVWIHDYHLLPLAAMLRAVFPALTIGFFLHIPFPSYELFRVIPTQWQRRIITGMLGADMIGFHTNEFAAHFLSCAEQLFKTEHDGQHILWENRQVRVDAFPISIDFDEFNNAWEDTEVKDVAQEYFLLKGDRRLIFSVDRLDYTKGISHRLKGYELFLKENPEYAEKVIFVMNVVPSRDSIPEYAERKKAIDEYIGDLNSRLGNITWQPVIYQYNHLSFKQLIALYIACDIALITPLRDGMNLVAKEFAASRKDKRGVLILSEMAGAAKELTNALLINPNDNAEIATMIRKGLEMPEEEQEDRMAAMQKRIREYDVVAWAEDFFHQLKHVKKLQQALDIKFLDNSSRVRLYREYAAASKRLILLDYDGSLVPFANLPSRAAPGANVLGILEQIAAAGENEVYIVSGRDSNTLDQWLGHLPVGLIAEHGAKVRHRNSEWETEKTALMHDWKPLVENVMNEYVARCPESFIEYKDFSLAWHYRNADLAQGAVRAKELFENLRQAVAHLPLIVQQGHKVIEVKEKGINKGAAIGKVIKGSDYDFILSVGDDKTDEDMFIKLAKLPEAYTIKVGNEASFAKYNLHTPFMVQSLLEHMSAQS